MSSLKIKIDNRKPELLSNGANLQINLGATVLERQGLVHLSIITMMQQNEASERLVPGAGEIISFCVLLCVSVSNCEYPLCSIDYSC